MDYQQKIKELIISYNHYVYLCDKERMYVKNRNKIPEYLENKTLDAYLRMERLRKELPHFDVAAYVDMQQSRIKTKH